MTWRGMGTGASCAPLSAPQAGQTSRTSQATSEGAHARYMLCSANTLVTLPDALSFETGAAISCGTGTAWGALKRLELMGEQTVAIFGQGPVGLSATQLAAALDARVIALDVSPDLLRRQVTLMGSWTFSTVGQAECAQFIAERGVDVDQLFTERWALDDAEKAYRHFDKQTGGKGVFVF